MAEEGDERRPDPAAGTPDSGGAPPPPALPVTEGPPLPEEEPPASEEAAVSEGPVAEEDPVAEEEAAAAEEPVSDPAVEQQSAEQLPEQPAAPEPPAPEPPVPEPPVLPSAPEPAAPPPSEEPVVFPPVAAAPPLGMLPAQGSGTGLPPIDFGKPRSIDSSAPPESRKYNPEEAQDRTRTWIAVALLVITAGIILAAFFMSFFALGATRPIDENLKTILALLNVIFGPIIALLGSVIGFYFGARSAIATGNAGGGGGGGTTQ